MKTRVGNKLDTSRLMTAIRGPGVDTRTWVTLAVALGDSVVDDKHGVFVDVLFVPSEEIYTARVSAVYAGTSFGMYRNIRKDDELVIVVPSGDPAEGSIVISQLHSAADIPPEQAVSDPEEFMIVIEPEKNMRLAVSGGGNIQIDAPDAKVIVNTPEADIGDIEADLGCVNILPADNSATIYEALEAFWNTTVKPKFDAFDAHVHPTGVGPSGPPAPLVQFPTMDTSAKSAKLKIPGDS